MSPRRLSREMEGLIFELREIHGKDIRAYSWFGDVEDEILLSPNMMFTVTEPMSMDGNMGYIHMIEQDTGKPLFS